MPRLALPIDTTVPEVAPWKSLPEKSRGGPFGTEPMLSLICYQQPQPQ
jgi:hypothetical protein